MFGRLLLVFGAIVYVNCQFIALDPSCGCRPAPPPTLVAPSSCAAPVSPPCACGGQLLALPPLDLLTALASLSPNCNVPLATAPCGCNVPLTAAPCGCNNAITPAIARPVGTPAVLSNALAGPVVVPNTLAQLLQGSAGQLILQNSCGCNAPNVVLTEKLLAPRTVISEACVAPRAVPEIIYNSPEIILNSPVAVPFSACDCGCSCDSYGCIPALPVGYPNPFLPAASPVSAMAPQVVSPLLPPVCPCENRALYLRKIPIPPPSI